MRTEKELREELEALIGADAIEAAGLHLAYVIAIEGLPGIGGTRKVTVSSEYYSLDHAEAGLERLLRNTRSYQDRNPHIEYRWTTERRPIEHGTEASPGDDVPPRGVHQPG